MHSLLTGVSAAAVAVALHAVPAAAQEAGGVERGADEITCLDISTMETALVPGVLYFVAGHRAGLGAAAEDAAAADVGTAEDPAVDEDETADTEAATEEGELATDEVEADEAETAEENGTALPEAAMDEEVPPDTGEADLAADEAAPAVVRVRGHFEIPIERTVIACAETPDALAADVIEAQRDAAMAEEGPAEEEG